jgi:hypothetical protein
MRILALAIALMALSGSGYAATNSQSHVADAAPGAVSGDQLKKETGSKEGFTRYWSPNGAFSVEFPGKWELVVSDNSIGAVSDPESDKDTFRDNTLVLFSDLDKEYDLKEYFDANVEQMKKTFSNFVVASEDQITVGGKDARKVVFSFTYGNGQELKTVQVYVNDGKKGYIIQGMGEKGSYDTFAPIFTDVISSFKFENPAQ